MIILTYGKQAGEGKENVLCLHTYLKYFEEQKAQMEARVALDTRRNRKAFAKLHITDKEGRPVTGVKVRVDQKSHDFKFGCNLFMLDQFPDEARNQAYRKEFKELFNYGIAPFYWADFELTDGAPRMGENPPDVYRRPAPEKILGYCGENGIDVKGHPLFWHKFLPDWLPADRDESFYRLDRRLRELSSEYGDRIRDWDCVNESLTRPCNYMRDTRLPRDYPGSIFKKAAKYFTNNRLFINDVTEIAWDDELGELSAYHMQIENLLLKGIPVDAIGMQYHMFYTPEELEKACGTVLQPGMPVQLYGYVRFLRPSAARFRGDGACLWGHAGEYGASGQDYGDALPHLVQPRADGGDRLVEPGGRHSGLRPLRKLRRGELLRGRPVKPRHDAQAPCTTC